MKQKGSKRVTAFGFLVASGLFIAWVALDYGIVKLVVELATWLMP